MTDEPEFIPFPPPITDDIIKLYDIRDTLDKRRSNALPAQARHLSIAITAVEDAILRIAFATRMVEPNSGGRRMLD